ncbi:MAG: TolC family protein [Bacteroidia bacterium]
MTSYTFKYNLSTLAVIRKKFWANAIKGKRLIFIFLLGTALTTWAGCSPEITESALPLDPPESFGHSGNMPLQEEWWTGFEDQTLNMFVNEALDSNFDLLAVWQRFRAAEAVVDRESSYLFPELEAFSVFGTSRPEPDFAGGENLRSGLSSVYEIDLWGRIRSRVKAEQYRAEASLYDYQATAISLSAEIARTWYQLLAEWQHLELAETQIETNDKILRLFKSRFGSGQIRGVDILRQTQLMEATRGQKILIESRIRILEHRFAVLIGAPPMEELIYAPDSFPALPPLPETGIPTELVQRRPDVRTAFSLLQVADREVASAISAKYPRLSISASVSSRANNVDDLFRDWAYSLGVNLVAPLFYGGRLSAEVDRAVAFKQQRLYEYGQTVLIAFREVEDALIQEMKQQERLQVLEQQVKLADQAYEQLRIEYFNGMSDYLAVLTAMDQAQQLQRELISERLALLEFRIALYRALAGGFETPAENADRNEQMDEE